MRARIAKSRQIRRLRDHRAIGIVSADSARTAARTRASRLRPFAFELHHTRVVPASSFQIELSPDLLARARGGDATAFEQIYRLFERAAYTLALRMLGQPDAARDVLHEAMFKVFMALGQYRNEAPFWAWLRQIVLNEALMKLRRRDPPTADVDADEIADIAPPPWVLADAQLLERALEKLPALTRSVLWLYHVEGYSHPEIAGMVGKTTSFSKSQLARGTARLRGLLDPQPESASCLLQTPQIG